MAMRVRYEVINGEMVAEKRGGVRRLYVPDPLGSTVALLDNTQTQTDAFSYWPYGEERPRTGTTPTPFRFVGTAGCYRDSASRVYIRARHLKTAQGRWLTQDPLVSGGAVVPYPYAWNSPALYPDPSREWPARHPGPCRGRCPGADGRWTRALIIALRPHPEAGVCSRSATTRDACTSPGPRRALSQRRCGPTDPASGLQPSCRG